MNCHEYNVQAIEDLDLTKIMDEIMDNNGKENRECNACSIHIITPNINALANEQNV